MPVSSLAAWWFTRLRIGRPTLGPGSSHCGGHALELVGCQSSIPWPKLWLTWPWPQKYSCKTGIDELFTLYGKAPASRFLLISLRFSSSIPYGKVGQVPHDYGGQVEQEYLPKRTGS